MLGEFFSDLRRRNPPLYWHGWLNVVLLFFALGMYFVDHTLITGINAWIKPMKFAISVAIYSWTFGWILFYLNNPKRQNFISWGVVTCMLVENGLIFTQAFRGVRSHYNVQTAFDAIAFSTMGLFILLNTFLVLYTIILFFSSRIELDTPLLWAWRAGLIFFFLGAISGGIMASILTHTVGAADGGPGLPFVNWSTVAGDIRSAHFVTLHGLQAMPLAAIVLMKLSHKYSKSGVLIVSTIYTLLCSYLHYLAFSGLPLIPLP